jgi:hypothetical protein
MPEPLENPPEGARIVAFDTDAGLAPDVLMFPSESPGSCLGISTLLLW